MDDVLMGALDALDPAGLDYSEWVSVGMALKQEGYDVSVWDAWSRNDSRYRAGECERKWRTFGGSSSVISGGTVVQMAKERGFKPRSDQQLEWDAVIEYDGDEGTAPLPAWKPTDDLRRYLTALFDSSDIVGYVTDSWQNEDGKHLPKKGVYGKTAGQLIETLDKYPDDIAYTVGDYNPEAGAWIRFNPLDGNGVGNDNVVSFRYALVESDTLTIAEQDALYRKLELPIACLVTSGGKSLHAIVRVDAPSYDEYRKRVQRLYDFLEENGCKIDKQNKNPSRLSRMPGVYRNGNQQRLVGVNLGRKSWNDWMDFVEGAESPLPAVWSIDDCLDDPIPLPPELIEGTLRQGHKMLIQAGSKAGKSLCLMQLATAICEGGMWMNRFRCRQGRVLYIDLEIDPPETMDRLRKIRAGMGYPYTRKDRTAGGLDVWSLRGNSMPLNELVPKITRHCKSVRYDVIILDPIYKVSMGDENSASEMGKFCNEIDRICVATGASMIYAHHHSKGAQGQKKAMDRGSGSGVLSRDPDAILDMTELVIPDDVRQKYLDNPKAKAFQVNATLRSFDPWEPTNIWFVYPLHTVDNTGVLAKCALEGTREANLSASGKRAGKEDRLEAFRTAYDVLRDACESVRPTVADIAKYLDLTDRTVRNYILSSLSDEYKIDHGVVWEVE